MKKEKNPWRIIKTKEDLPPEGKYVLGKYNGGNWISKSDPEGICKVVVRCMRGISQKERELLPDKDIRKLTYLQEDEFENNKVPWAWSEAGPTNFFGQEILEWKFLD